MNLGDCTVTIGNQKVHVTNVGMSYDMGRSTREVSIEGRIFEEDIREDTMATRDGIMGSFEHTFSIGHLDGGVDSIALFNNPFAVIGNVKTNTPQGIYTLIGDNKMNCGQKSLSEKLADLDQDESRQVLIRHGLMTSAGVLTNEGANFLLTMLAREYEEKMAEAVTEVKEAEQE